MKASSGDQTLKKTGLRIVGMLALLAAIYLAQAQALAQDSPVARITYPTLGQTISGNITIQGTATSPSFAQYTVAYAAEPDLATWTDINGAVQPQANGMLAVWNTRPVPNGTYAIRLQVVNSDGTTTETIVRELTIANTEAAGGNETSGTVTDTTGAVVTATDSISGTTIAGIDTSQLDTSLNLSDIPHAFVSGMRYALYAFVALGAYLLLKKLIGLLIQKAFHKPIDYGR
jgi:methionine-rich copper-binding protein CopC